MAIVALRTGNINHEIWLAWRKKGIGGSDVGAICGLNKWKSPFAVYMDKLGLSEEREESQAAYFGKVLEDVVAKEFSLRTGLKVKKRNAMLQHEKYPFMLANVDRLIVGQKVGLECKTVSEFGKDEWLGEEIPESYLLQCQHYMAVTGYESWWIACLIGGNKFIYKEVKRDEELINYLIEIEKNFWVDHVEKQVPPEIDGSESTADILKNLYPSSVEGSEVILPFGALDLIDHRITLKQQIKDLTTKCDEYENKLKGMLESNENGYVDKYKIVWKSYESNRLDTKKLKNELPDIYEKYINKSNIRKFDIKEVKEKIQL